MYSLIDSWKKEPQLFGEFSCRNYFMVLLNVNKEKEKEESI